MATYPQSRLVTVEDYLASEDGSDVRHEYIDGRLNAMTGASVQHNRIARDTLIALEAQLRGSPCEVFMSDVKLYLTSEGEEIF